MKTDRFERACCWPMNSVRRCGRNEPSALSSSRRSALTSLGAELKCSSQGPLAAIFVRQQLADGRDGGPVSSGYNDASVAVVIPNELRQLPQGETTAMERSGSTR